MTLISLLSAFATVLGLSGAIPQIIRMVRARSAAGQSPVGWLMGGLCHACMVYVNAVGHHATLLAVGNVVTLALCTTAVAVIVSLRGRSRTPSATPAPAEELVALPTQEFQLLADAVRVAERRRTAAAA